MAVPPVAHRALDQPAGKAVPENSAPAVGASITSPLLVWETYVLALVVPALKSVVVVSVTVKGPVVKDQVMLEPTRLPLVSVMVPATVT